MTPLNNGYFAIPIPDDAPTDPQRYGITHIFHGEDILYYTDDEGKSVPIGNVGSQSFKVICTSKGITEEQAAEIVDRQRGGGQFKDYTLTGSLAKYGTYTLYNATNSFRSLLRSLLRSLNLTGNYAIIKKL